MNANIANQSCYGAVMFSYEKVLIIGIDYTLLETSVGCGPQQV